MNRLVYVAYFFPPTGGAGVQRTVKFVRDLAHLGWDIRVITPRSPGYWMEDETLLREVPETVQVCRTVAWTGHTLLGAFRARGAAGERNARRSGRTQGRLRRIANWFLVPDAFVGWVPFAARAAATQLGSGGVLLTTSSPDSAHLVGLRLKRRLPIGWVADFRDPWIRRMSYDPPTEVHHRLHSSLEAAVVKRADRIVVTSEATRADFLSRYPRLDPNRIVCITNGYDEEDFPAPEPAPDPSFLLLHLGQLNPERPVGPLLDHLDAFFALRPQARTLTRVELIGPRYHEDEAEVAHRGYGPIVRFVDALPHREAVRRLFAARVLLLMEQESERGGLILPGKVFEYLRADRPIYGILPAGAAADLITETGSGAAFPGSGAADGAVYLARMYDAYQAGDVAVRAGGPDRSRIRGFERRVLAQKLAGVLREASMLRRR